MNIFTIKYRIRSAFSYLLSILAFPQMCISCGRTSYSIPLCKRCCLEMRANLAPQEKRCSVCGRILISELNICLLCRNPEQKKEENIAAAAQIRGIDGIFPLYPYILWKKELLFAWKTAGNRSLSPFFAALAYQILKNQYNSLPIVPVPPRPGKIKARGWDQIDELCTYLHKLYGLNVYKLLIRFSKDQQKKLNREERLAHRGKSYGLHPKISQLLENPPPAVVLVDDIITTGVTLETCATLLKSIGIKQVYALTLFYVS